MTHDEWYLDQPVRLPNQQRGRVERLTKTIVVLADGTRWRRKDGRQSLLASADAVCFWRGRIKFRGASAGAPFDSLFAAWNCRSRFVEAFAPHGAILGRVS